MSPGKTAILKLSAPLLNHLLPPFIHSLVRNSFKAVTSCHVLWTEILTAQTEAIQNISSANNIFKHNFLWYILFNSDCITCRAS